MEFYIGIWEQRGMNIGDISAASGPRCAMPVRNILLHNVRNAFTCGYPRDSIQYFKYMCQFCLIGQQTQFAMPVQSIKQVAEVTNPGGR